MAPPTGTPGTMRNRGERRTERTAMTPNRRSTVQEPPHHRKASSPAWPAFESKLAEALAVLEEDQYLVITEKRGWAYVQFAGQGSFGVRAECVSNNYLDEAHALRASQMTALRRIGWSDRRSAAGHTYSSPGRARSASAPSASVTTTSTRLTRCARAR